MSLNIQIVFGNLTKGATIQKIGERDKLSFTMADNNGDYTEFFPVAVWGKSGAFDKLAVHLVKGKYVTVKGKLVWLEQGEANGVKYDNIIVDCMGARSVKLGPDGKGSEPSKDKPQDAPNQLSKEQQNQADKALEQAPQPAPDYDLNDDDIPF